MEQQAGPPSSAAGSGAAGDGVAGVSRQPAMPPGAIKLSPEDLFAISSGTQAASYGFFTMPPGSGAAGSSPWAPLPFVPAGRGGSELPSYAHHQQPQQPHAGAPPWAADWQAPSMQPMMPMAAARPDDQTFEQGLRSLLSMGATSRVTMPPKPSEAFWSTHQSAHVVPQRQPPAASHHLHHAPPPPTTTTAAATAAAAAAAALYNQRQQHMYSLWQQQQQQQQQQQHGPPVDLRFGYSPIGGPFGIGTATGTTPPTSMYIDPTTLHLHPRLPHHGSGGAAGYALPSEQLEYLRMPPTRDAMAHASPSASSFSSSSSSASSSSVISAASSPHSIESPELLAPSNDASCTGDQQPPSNSDDKAETTTTVCRGPPASDVSGSRVSELATRLLGSHPLPSEATFNSISLGALSMVRSIQPPRFDHQQREELLSRLQRFMEEGFPRFNPKLHLFGSSANGFCLKDGDIDLCLTIEKRAGSRKSVVSQLTGILKKRKMHNITSLATARVPIVKFQDPKTRYRCDICVNNTLALRNTQLLRDYAMIDDRFKIIVLVVKFWAKRREINNPYAGSLSSYAYVLLVLQFLQQQHPPVLPRLQELALETEPRVIVEGFDTTYYEDVASLRGFGLPNQRSVGELLVQFFRFYAYEFDYSNKVVAPRTGGFFTKEEKEWQISRKRECCYFCLEDPFNVKHNLGRGVDVQGLQWVRCEFERAYRVLVTSGSVNELCRQWMQNESIKSTFAETEIKAAVELEEQLSKEQESAEDQAKPGEGATDIVDNATADEHDHDDENERE